VSLGVLVVQMLLAPSPPVRAAESIDLVLGRVLPASHEQPRALMTLGFPDRCGTVIGATARSPMGESLAQQCPEAATVPGSRVVSLLSAEPSILGRMWARAAPLARAGLQHDLGVVAGRPFATLADLASPLAFSFAPLVERLPLLA